MSVEFVDTIQHQNTKLSYNPLRVCSQVTREPLLLTKEGKGKKKETVDLGLVWAAGIWLEVSFVEITAMEMNWDLSHFYMTKPKIKFPLCSHLSDSLAMRNQHIRLGE